VNQRWRAGRASYRPAGETINQLRYEVAAIEGDTEPKRFVVEHHYSGTYPAARFRFGLYRGAALVGVAVFSHPCNDRVLTAVFGGQAIEAVELGRFVLLDDVEGNGETWFLARCFRELRRLELRGVVSFSDPMPRTSAAGIRVFPGHVGTIYQAHNGRYLGRGTARTLRLLPDGSVLNARTVQKIRTGERGWRYAAEQLTRAGAPAVPTDPAARLRWLQGALGGLRTLSHPGNHRYAWAFGRAALALPARPFPKAHDAAPQELF
jgi:hypothetical protein